jgi:hypothetical protein
MDGFTARTGSTTGLLTDDPAAGVFRVHRRAVLDLDALRRQGRVSFIL